ncbi:hypothetical protein KC343_g4538 [Hortaea werneckii]|uniref:Apple domain-containing protein n=1 Tax=Hortaea werneckii TaxID=91943 RepID=A0A3M7HG22_HORWE|nr:hypothetical protein KC352_g12506 [Hortaea werneckii]KAI7570012.1 hypothetical protein KC317_g2837 [Hortaea werneckii]KAI7619297.1 hypothetical protein KC346_g4649 [Hortaea werneckii]KAI7630591.1 hypothetical protein KC343_g4538 [Hortaea werneckii]KAI7660089.1 hypothetical protein KC319_g8746 [Hortaea werneckii]
MKFARPYHLALGRYALLLWGATSPVKAQLPSSCPVTITVTQLVTTFPPDYTGSYTLSGITAIPSINLPHSPIIPTSLVDIPTPAIGISTNVIPGGSIVTGILPTNLPIGPSAAPTGSATVLPTSTSLACNSTQQSYLYVDPSSGDQYTIECDTTYSGGLLEVTQTTSISTCIAECSSLELCQGVGYDTSTAGCAKYLSQVPDSGVYSPTVQFARLSKRPVVIGGSTLLEAIPTSFVSSGINVQGSVTFTYALPTISIVAPTSFPAVSVPLSYLDITTALPSSLLDITTALPLSSLDISNVLPSSYLDVTTALPLPPLPSLDVTTVLPVSSLGISNLLPSSYLDVTTALPLPSLDITTALPLPSLDITTALPLPSLDITTALPLPSLDITPTLPLTSLGISNVLPSSYLDINTALPLPSLDISSGLPLSFSVPIFEPGTTGEPYIPYPSISAVQTLASAIPTSVIPVQTSYSELVCPENDGQLVSENGPTYVVGCGKGVSGVPYSADQASNSFDECFTECDKSSTTQGAQYCTAFLYLGAANGDGMGTCYLYNDVGAAFVRGNSSAVAAIRLANYVAGIPGGLPISVSAGLSASLGGMPTTLLPSDLATGSLDLPITLPTAPGASVINSLANPTATCTNGGNVLDGCVIAQVTADPSVGAGVGVGIGGPNSTIVDIQASVTAAASLSLGATAGVGLGLDSSGLSASLGLSAGLGLSVDVGGGGSVGLPGLPGVPGIGKGSPATTSASKITTVIPVITVESTTTITSCSTAGGALTCSNIPLLATLSTTSNTGSATVYIAYTTTLTTSMAPRPSATSSCVTLINNSILCLPTDVLSSASASQTSLSTSAPGSSSGSPGDSSTLSRSTSASTFSTLKRPASASVVSTIGTISGSTYSAANTAATASCGGLVNGVLQVCASPVLCAGGLTC